MRQRGAFALLEDSMHVAYKRPYTLQEVGRVLFTARRPAGAGFEIEEGSWEKLGQQRNMAWICEIPAIDRTRTAFDCSVTSIFRGPCCSAEPPLFCDEVLAAAMPLPSARLE